MRDRHSNYSCACLPIESLPRLAVLRDRPELLVALQGDLAWLFWPAVDDDVRQFLLPLRGGTLYQRKDGHWHREGRRLPASEVPDDADSVPIAEVLLPTPLRLAGGTDCPALAPTLLSLVRDSVPRPATALRIAVHCLLPWVERATSHQLGRLRAAHCGDVLLLRGPVLPHVAEGERFWGEDVLMPIGQVSDPALSTRLLREALGLVDGDVALVRESAIELIPGTAFGPVTRGGIRLVAREVAK